MRQLIYYQTYWHLFQSPRKEIPWWPSQLQSVSCLPAKPAGVGTQISLCRGKLNCLVIGRSKQTVWCQTRGSGVGPPAQWLCRLIPCSAFSPPSQNLKSSKCCQLCLSQGGHQACAECSSYLTPLLQAAEFSSFLISLLIVPRKHVLRGERCTWQHLSPSLPALCRCDYLGWAPGSWRGTGCVQSISGVNLCWTP